jgi:hypothetical protein
LSTAREETTKLIKSSVLEEKNGLPNIQLFIAFLFSKLFLAHHPHLNTIHTNAKVRTNKLVPCVLVNLATLKDGQIGDRGDRGREREKKRRKRCEKRWRRQVVAKRRQAGGKVPEIII